MRSPLLLVVMFALCAAAVGCTHVKPYEREYLAHPGMDRKREALADEFEAHAHDSREGAMGSTSSTGGGCGCN
ncbi:MAG TPA: DUF4266 domain-containing protein [Polyangiales bacterium]|jgi:hypothetical protein|nr:DUF4266 domain-containing protein [Polyangiales bacterium]